MNSCLSKRFLSRNSVRAYCCKSITAGCIGLAAALLLTPGPASAANLLVNPSFEQNSGHAIPLGWTRFAPPTAQSFGNYWIEAAVTPEQGSEYYKEWGASYGAQPTNVAGIYQDLSAAAGSTYQANGWFYTHSTDLLGADCYVWIEVLFLSPSSNVLAGFASDHFMASAGADTWIPNQVNHAYDISQPVSINDPYFTTYAVTGTVSQLTAPAGTAKVRFRFAFAQLNAEGGSCFFDNAVLNQLSGSVPPSISSLFPQNMIFVNPADGISFNVSSPSGFTITSNNIGLILNGTNVSAGLAISGSSSNKNVTYHGLLSNAVYNASITVTDAFGLTASANSHFETTWFGVPPVLYTWEAEDFDFTNGLYYDLPALCGTIGSPNCYFGTVGVEGVDEHVNGNPAPSHVYRPDDAVGTVISGDYARKDHSLAGVFDYRIDPLNYGMWLNYTRDWSNGTYWVIGRLSSGLSPGVITLSVVNPDTSTTDLGTFGLTNGTDWSAFQYIFLKDTNGQNAVVALTNKMTLRITSGGNLLPNFFMLVAAEPDLPLLSNMYPTGSRPFEPTNTFSFTVSTLGSSFPANGIQVNLDGNDVSSKLVVTGSASVKNVVYTNLLPNAVHTAVLAITNVLGHGILVTNNFDTFTEDNFMVEGEDFDYGGGQFIYDWFPDAYGDVPNGPYPAVTNIDFQHTHLDGEVFKYRTVGGIPQDNLGTKDYLRLAWQNSFSPDYVLVFFAGGDWANYTRVYPAGNYYAYIRSSGDGPYSMYLDQVVSGAGTTSQVTKRLGHFGGFGRSPAYAIFDWVPLTDDGLAASAIVRFNGGTNTLRLTTAGNCNPNFFMFVPVSGITMTATRSAGKTVLSFPTQADVNYRVFYRTNLTTDTWAYLTNVLGNGAVKSVTDPATSSPRFYKVTAP
ncbi:MAG TPA: hypothetical protein VN578_04735 [Candidatus Binatia bacterium]|nr:hypothetical protein [Candidatus Binatia bacterium]